MENSERHDLQSDSINTALYKYFAGAMWLGLAAYWLFIDKPFSWGHAAIALLLLLMSLFHFSLAVVQVRGEVLYYRRFLEWIPIRKIDVVHSGVFFAFGYVRLNHFTFPWGKIYFIPDEDSGPRPGIRTNRGIFRFLHDRTRGQTRNPVNSAGSVGWRDASLADEPALLPMMRALAAQEPAIAFDELELHPVLSLFFSHPEWGRIWVLDDAGRAVGYVILTLGFSFEYRGRDAFIDELYIQPEFRGRGFGRSGMQLAEDCARQFGVNALHLEVDHANHSALKFYRRLRYQDHRRHLLTKWLRE